MLNALNERMPNWLRGMKVEIAAAYIGLSISTFLSLVAGGRAPWPTWITPGRKIWLREDLDLWLDRMRGDKETAKVEPEAWLGRLDNEGPPAIS